MQASSLMSWGRQFQAFGADMRKALSPNFSLDRGVNSSSSVVSLIPIADERMGMEIKLLRSLENTCHT